MRLTRTLILTGAAVLTALPGYTLAQVPDSVPPPAIVVAQQNGPSLSEAVEQVRRQYRGRIVSAETRVRGNREVHIIKVLTEDGKVKTVRISGRTRGGRS